MRRWWLVAGCAALLACPEARLLAQAIEQPKLPGLERSMSSSQQFIIYYPDKAVRSRLARKLEDIKSAWLRRLSLRDEWKAPIIVRLQTVSSANTPRIVTSLYQSDSDELKIQVDVNEPTVLQSADFDIEIYRALCLEYAYRSKPPQAGKAYSQPPAWLLEGFYEDSMSADSGIAPGLYDALIERGPPPKIEAFLKQRPTFLEATSRSIYRAQAMGLLRGLLGLPEGPRGLAAYLSSLPSIDSTDVKPLIDAFPSLSSDPVRLSKLWVLSMANVSASDRIQPLALDETLRQLSTIMDMKAPADPKKPKELPKVGAAAMPEIARSETGRYTLTQKSEHLLRLEVRAHPLLRPIIEEYRLIASELAFKPKKKVDDRIAKNGELLKAVTDRSTQVNDYLNWYEATQLQTPSGQFSAVMTGEENPAPHRNDAVSRALDDLEARGW